MNLLLIDERGEDIFSMLIEIELRGGPIGVGKNNF